MKTINITVRDKLPVVSAMSGTAVTDNKYKLIFDFDDEWQDGLKSVVVAGNRRQYVVYPTETNEVEIELGDARVVSVGVIQDVIATSRPCEIRVNESIKRRMGVEIVPPEDDVWTYITEQIRLLNAAKLEPVAATSDMTQDVGRTEDGRLVTKPTTSTGGGSGGGSGKGVENFLLGVTTDSGIGTSGYRLTIVLENGDELAVELPDMGIALSDVVTVADTAPTASTDGAEGELWFDKTAKILYICTGEKQQDGGIVVPGLREWVAAGGAADNLPEITEADAGRILRIADGVPVWSEIPPAETVVNRTRSVSPLVTFADDDGRAEVWSKLKPLSETYGIPFVSAMITDRIGTDGYLTAEQLLSLQDMGWEIASHTMRDARLGDLTDAEQEEQLRGSKEALEAIGIRVDTICYPYSSTNDSTWKIARKYYRAGRQTNWKERMNESPLETWDLRVTPIGSYYETQTESGLDTSTLEYYKWMVDKAVSENAWLIFMTHCEETDDTQMGYLAQVIEYVQSLGIPVVTIREGLDRRGNIVDVGRYDRRNPEDEHFVVGCDSTVEKSAPDKYAVNLPANSVTNDTPPSWFPWNTVSTCRVTGSTAGFPFQANFYGGTLVTNTMGSATMHDLNYRDYTDGRTWQEFYIPKSIAVYRRYAIDADTWSDWSYGSDVVLAQDSRTIDDLVTAFPKGMRSKVYLTQNTETTALPGYHGWLTTDRTSDTLEYQIWQAHSANGIAGYMYYRTWNGSAWDDWSALGERTMGTWASNKDWTPKVVGASIFNSDLGKPVWWNGTAWIGAEDAAIDKVSKAIADNKSNIDKLVELNSERIITGDEYEWVAGYFDSNGHFNGAYYYRIAISQWFAVESGGTYRFESNSTDKLLIRGYSGTSGYDFVETLVTLESDETVIIPDNVSYITITLSRDENNGDSIEIVNQMLADAEAGLINPTVTKQFVSNVPDLTGYVRTVNGISPDENGNVEIDNANGGNGSTNEVWEDIIDFTLDEDVTMLHISNDLSGNTFALKEFKVFVVQTPIAGKTTNDLLCMTINGQGWGSTSALRLTGTPKETDETIYAYFHIKTIDGVMEKVHANSSANYSSVREMLTERVGRNNYESEFRFVVDKNTDTLMTIAMPCTQISIVGIGGTILGTGSRIKVRGVRA